MRVDVGLIELQNILGERLKAVTKSGLSPAEIEREIAISNAASTTAKEMIRNASLMIKEGKVSGVDAESLIKGSEVVDGKTE